MCVLIFCTNVSDLFLILRRIPRNIVQSTAALVRFWWKLDCLNWFSKNTQISNF